MVDPRTLAGRYRLTKLAGAGGMGQVWIAVDESLDRLVAVKVMTDDTSDDPEARERFLREAKAAAKIQSPHVVQILDYGVDETPFIVMEMLRGEDLRDRLKRVGRLPLDEATPLVKQLAKGLKKAHDLGFIHRDIKPANLFITEEDGEETLKILDFGVVKSALSRSVTSAGRLLGSPHFMSPEQAQGLRQLDHRADIWAVGVVVYKTISGAQPFSGKNEIDLLMAISEGRYTPASAVDPAFATFDVFFQRCFVPNPDERFQSLPELVVAYEAAVAATPSPITKEELRGLKATLPLTGRAPPAPKSWRSTVPLPTIIPATTRSLRKPLPLAVTTRPRRSNSRAFWILAAATIVVLATGVALYFAKFQPNILP